MEQEKKGTNMKEGIVKVINNIYFWPKGISICHYYNFIFTHNRIVLEFINKNTRTPAAAGGYYGGGIFLQSIIDFFKRKKEIKKQFQNDSILEKDVSKILYKDSKNFTIDYYGIDNVIIKKGIFILRLIREYPLIGKECKFHFPKDKQYNVESIFMKMLPTKTTTQ